MSTHNINFHGEKRKILVLFGGKKSGLSGAMVLWDHCANLDLFENRIVSRCEWCCK